MKTPPMGLHRFRWWKAMILFMGLVTLALWLECDAEGQQIRAQAEDNRQFFEETKR